MDASSYLWRIGVLVSTLALFSPCYAGPVYTPRDSGTEPPGGPRAPIALPESAGSFGRTAEGGMGYTDAYGNTISSEPRPRPPKKRLPKGAFGKSDLQAYDRPLPDPSPRPSTPAWSFR